ncbi:MAG: hypothetical protein KKB85_00570 [Candidatus Altiarchaeota archaeon]|nr:hypothetical protein [Candidatus Altiarchaeota archaeon]
MKKNGLIDIGIHTLTFAQQLIIVVYGVYLGMGGYQRLNPFNIWDIEELWGILTFFSYIIFGFVKDKLKNLKSDYLE